MAAEHPVNLPDFTGMIGGASDPLSTPSLPTFATKVAEEIVAISDDAGGAWRSSYPSGGWYPLAMTNQFTTTPTQSRLELYRWEFPPDTTCVSMGEEITTGVATAVRRLGIYADDGTGCYPGALIKDAGTCDAATAGWKQAGGADFSAVAIGGIVWVGGVLQVTTGVVVRGAIGAGRGMMDTATPPQAATSDWRSYSQDSVTGALPGTFTSTRTIRNSGLKIWIKTG